MRDQFIVQIGEVDGIKVSRDMSSGSGNIFLDCPSGDDPSKRVTLCLSRELVVALAQLVFQDREDHTREPDLLLVREFIKVNRTYRLQKMVLGMFRDTWQTVAGG